MRERQLHIWGEDENISAINLLEVIIRENPQLKGTQIPVKAYASGLHGSESPEVVELINVDDFMKEIDDFRKRVFNEKKTDWPAWYTGIGGVFYRDGMPEYFVPMVDLETVSSSSLIRDMTKLETSLLALDIDASIVKSGDPDMGGYFIVGYDVQPYKPGFWQFMGKVLTALNYGNSSNANMAKDFGGRLLKCATLEEAQDIAQKILKEVPSIDNGTEREGLFCDPRWIAHRLIDGFTILRITAGKNYTREPQQVAGIRSVD